MTSQWFCRRRRVATDRAPHLSSLAARIRINSIAVVSSLSSSLLLRLEGKWALDRASILVSDSNTMKTAVLATLFGTAAAFAPVQNGGTFLEASTSIS